MTFHLGAHAATDVTGFGILGHAQNLATHQIANVDFVLESLPIIADMNRVATTAKENGLNFKLVDGYSAETSGGLLVSLAPDDAHKFCDDILRTEGYTAWVVGKVIAGSKQATVCHDVKVIEVNCFSN